MCTVWHVDKYKNYISISYQFQENLSQPGIIDVRARYRAATRQLRNTELNRIYFLLSAPHRVSDSKNSTTIPSTLSPKVS